MNVLRGGTNGYSGGGEKIGNCGINSGMIGFVRRKSGKKEVPDKKSDRENIWIFSAECRKKLKKKLHKSFSILWKN